MLFALGAVSSALGAIQSLTNSKSSSSTQKTGSTQGATNPFAIDSGSSTTSGAASSVNSGRYPQISPETMNALFAAQGQSTDTSGATSSSSTGSASSASKSPEDALKDLFSQIDGDGDGKITKSEFEDALGAGGTNLAKADEVFSKMDANADGDINLGEMTKALRGGHGHHAEGAGSSGGGSGLLVAIRRRLDVDHDDQCRRLDHHHRHLCRRLQDVDHGAGCLQQFECQRRRQFAL